MLRVALRVLAVPCLLVALLAAFVFVGAVRSGADSPAAEANALLTLTVLILAFGTGLFCLAAAAGLQELLRIRQALEDRRS